MRRLIECLIFLCAVSLASFAVVAAPSGQDLPGKAGAVHKRMLVLFPFNNNVPSLHQIVAGIDGVIQSRNMKASDVVYEYLDITPPRSPSQRADLRELLLNKYAGEEFGLIVTYGSAALDFLQNEGATLSPESPAITLFSGNSHGGGQPGRSGAQIPLQLDSRGTLDLALALFPDTRKVLFVAGTSPNDKVFLEQARADFASAPKQIEIEYSGDRSVEQLNKYVAELPPHTVVIYSDVASDATGQSFVPRDVAKSLASLSTAPVFGLFSSQIDTGLVGGAMIDMELVGKMLGNVLLGLNNGKPLVVEPSSGYILPMFNWKQIERWGGKSDQLPANSVFANRPVTLWGQYRKEVLGALTLIFVLSGMTVTLIIQNRRRRIAEISARESAYQLSMERDQLEQRVTKRTEYLAEALEFSETILLNSPLPMGIYAEGGQCVQANEAYATLFGTTREALMAQNFHEIPSWQKMTLLGDCLAALTLKTSQQRETHIVSSSGKEVWVEYRILPRYLKGQEHLLIQFYDLTERKRTENELRQWAFHDPLTQLPNRRLLLDRLEQTLRFDKRENGYLAVLYLDLNKFKLLNDRYGHDTGDLMLIEVARRLQGVVRESDTVSRLGGDEFVVLLARLGPDFAEAKQYAESVVEKIHAALSREYLLNNVHYHGSASIGFRLVLGGDDDPDQILKAADDAMYAAKSGVSQ